jgi:hypothetical protein
MPNRYSLIDKANDATAFVATAFGKHYLARLNKKRAAALEVAMDLTFTDSHRAHQATIASALTKEIEYFQNMESTLNDPKAIAKLRAKAKETAKK